MLFMERINDFLQRMWGRIEIIAIQLNGKTATPCIVNSYIPAAANPQISAFRLNNYEAFASQLAQDITRMVTAVIIDNNHIILEIGLLLQCTFHGIGYRSLAIIHGNDDRGLAIERLTVKVWRFIIMRINACTNGFEMQSNSFFHFYLHLAVARIDVIELAFTALSRIRLLCCVEIFIDMEEFPFATEEQTQVVKSGKSKLMTALFAASCSIFMQQIGTNEQQGTEIKIVTQTPHLVVYNWMLLAFPVNNRMIIAVNQGRMGICGHTKQAVKCMLA